MKEENILIYAIIPAEIYKTKKLTSEEKLIAERITALCRNKGYSWITNKALATMYGIREDTVSKHIKKLERFGFIKCVYNWKSENKSKRKVYLCNDIWDEKAISSMIKKREDIYYMCQQNNNNNSNDNNYINNKNIMLNNDR